MVGIFFGAQYAANRAVIYLSMIAQGGETSTVKPKESL
jgi:hypothetical protein